MRINLPGENWAEIKDADSLTGADQDAYYDAYDAIMNAKPQPEPRPDPANPAVMLDPPRPRLTIADNRAMRDTVLGIGITSWSFGLPLPFTAEVRRQLPARVVNALYEEAAKLDAVLAGSEEETPKSPEPSPGSDGSSGSLPASTENHPLELPEGL